MGGVRSCRLKITSPRIFRVLFLFFLFGLILLFEGIGRAESTVLPLPAISTARNEGTTAGLFTVLLFTDNTGIYRILAPMATDNSLTGPQLSFTWLEYLGGGRNLSLILLQSTGIDQEYTLKYRDLGMWGGRLGLDTKFTRLRDSTFRFFGFSPQSLRSNETNYADGEIGYLVTVRYQPSRLLWLGFSERVREVEIGPGRVNNLPFLRDRFPAIPGALGSTVLGHRLTFTYDTRDLEITPSSGSLVTLYSEINRNFEPRNDRFYASTLLDGRTYVSTADGRFGTAIRGEIFMTGGHQIPFYEQATLGGEDSLRDYGRNRFIDQNLLLFNLEERIRVFSHPLFGVVPEFSIAPFLDIGQVFGGFSDKVGKYAEFNPGLGLRGIVRPNVVGRIDIGFGKEGTTIFVGSDFPF